MERIDRYEILSEIGRRAVEIRYKARDTETGKIVLLREFLFPQDVRPLLVRELVLNLNRRVQQVANLSHPSIAPIYNRIVEGERYFLVTEVLEGRSLRELIDSGQPITKAKVMDWAVQLCSALTYLHERGIVQGDLQPENILIQEDGTVKIADLGFSALVAEVGEVKEKPKVLRENYMSPERFRGLKDADERSDLYSLGIILYEILTGKLPFEASDREAIFSRVVTEEPLDPQILNPSISKEINRVIMRAIVRDPVRRFQKAREMVAALKEIIEEGRYESSPEEQEAIAQQAQRVLRVRELKVKAERFWRRRSTIVIGALVAIAIVLAIFYLSTTEKRIEYVTEATPPLEVVKLYYQGLEKLDPILLDQVTTGSANTYVTQLVVVLRVREAMVWKLPTYKMRDLKIEMVSVSDAEALAKATYIHTKMFEEKGQSVEREVKSEDNLKLKRVKGKWAIYEIVTKDMG